MFPETAPLPISNHFRDGTTLRDRCKRASGDNGDSDSESWYATHVNLLRLSGL
jgi:hypothetical protein